VLDEKTRDKIIAFVKKEPRTVQEVAQHIGKTWVTTESYIQQIESKTAVVRLKTFRKGTQGALKLVYYNYAESAGSDAIRESLYTQIRSSRFKHHFDFLEVFQFAHETKKQFFSCLAEKNC
jgi:predicted transcriptional regulator